MKILLDTCVFIWILQDSKKLTKNARNLISNASEIHISAVSIWEMMIKSQLGKLKIDFDICLDVIKQNDFLELPITYSHVLTLQKLPDLHRDPFDRILIAQALTEPLKILTADHIIKQYIPDITELIL